MNNSQTPENPGTPAGHWAWTVALLYGLILIVLTVPVIRLAFWSDTGIRPLEVYQCWPFWAGVAVMILCQVALLGVPVRVAGHRPVPQRSIFLTVLVGGLMVGLLVMGAALSSLEFFYTNTSVPDWVMWAAWGAGPATWLIWTAVFFRASRHTNPSSLVTTQCRRLLQGSILEFLIAVPTHIVARHRSYCCAGLLTFLGLTAGIAVMLFAFGPAVFALYVERWKRLHPSSSTEPPDPSLASPHKKEQP